MASVDSHSDEQNTLTKRSGSRVFLQYLGKKFNLDEDKATQEEVVCNISRGVEFQGTNLWVLIFATFVASIGLNVNSAAVIIGAMLISPLMGPIMGIGLSIGINDFELLKRSLRNFGFMVLVSIVTSTLYFLISPLDQAQSELLARTTPTTYDVLIAFFGGLAGIVAQSRKDRTSTVIPGVAIATALMPPLCTAGFGLGTGQLNYFFGAFYLFFINTVFIALATYCIVRFLKYDKKEFVDKVREMRVKRYMVLTVLITLIPSFFIAYRIVQRTWFETNADRFVTNVLRFDKAKVIDYKRVYHPDSSLIDVVLLGDVVSQDAIENAQAQLSAYNLDKTRLVVRQSRDTEQVDFSTMQLSYSELLHEKNKQIKDLQQRLSQRKVDSVAAKDICRELGAIVGPVSRIALSKSIEYSPAGAPQDTTMLCVIVRDKTSGKIDRDKVVKWLQVRTQTEKSEIVYRIKHGLRKDMS